jgi:hypothetical protein
MYASHVTSQAMISLLPSVDQPRHVGRVETTFLLDH